MKRLLLSAAVCGGLVVSAHAQTSFKRTQDFEWKIAQRFDDGRVVIMLSMDDNYLSQPERDAIVGARLPGKSAATYLTGVSRAQPDWVRRSSPSSAQIGDRWAFDGGRAGWFHAAINDFVIANAGCSEAGALSAAVDVSERAAFGRVKEKYFPVHALDGWAPSMAPTAVGSVSYAITSAEHRDIERLLREQFRQTSGSITAEMSDNGRDKQTGYFRDAYARIARGEGRIQFDSQAFLVTPDRIPRLFVRSVFRLDGKQVYFLSAWIKTKPVMTVDAADAGASGLAWMRENDYDRAEPSINGLVINVTDIDRDGRAELIMEYDGYESFVLDLVPYPPAKRFDKNVLARWGAGC